MSIHGKDLKDISQLKEKGFRFYNFNEEEFTDTFTSGHCTYDDFSYEGILKLAKLVTTLKDEEEETVDVATIVEEEEESYIIPGAHCVNRTGYIVYVRPDNERIDDYYSLNK